MLLPIFVSLCFMNEILRMQGVTGWEVTEEMWDTWNVERVEAWEWPVCGDMSWPPSPVTGQGNSVSSESDEKPHWAQLSQPDDVCLLAFTDVNIPEKLFLTISPRLVKMSPVHLEIADWQLPFLGLSRSNSSHSNNYLDSKQGLSSYTFNETSSKSKYVCLSSRYLKFL